LRGGTLGWTSKGRIEKRGEQGLAARKPIPGPEEVGKRGELENSGKEKKRSEGGAEDARKSIIRL